MMIKAYYTCILGTAKDLPKQVEKSLSRFVPERQKVRRTFGVRRTFAFHSHYYSQTFHTLAGHQA